MDDLTDEALMMRVAVGESRPLEILIHRYRRRVYGVVFRAVGRTSEADDLFQETWIRVARRASTFDPARRFAPWVATIATNLALDASRRAARYVDDDAEARADEQGEGTAGPEQALLAAHARQDITRALAALPDRMRQAVLLRYFDELSEEEMAASLGVPRGTVKSRLHNALKSLRRGLGEHDDVA
jgi:RNA polymerase sigma-70 factor (ECF subfamily)